MSNRKTTGWTALIAAAVFAASTPTARADAGFFGGFIEIDDGSSQWYELVGFAANALTDFESADLGTFAPGDTLRLSNSEGLTFKNDSSDVTGVSTNYRVTKVGDVPGSFASVAHNFGANAPSTAADGNGFGGGGDQSWGNLGDIVAEIDLLALATAGQGVYEVEVFLSGSTNGVNVAGTIFLSDFGNNFTATFTVVPTPAALPAGLTLAAMLALRRRNRR